MKYTISIVIPNYNGEKLLKKNLPILLKLVKTAQVVIVDDASTDGSVDYLRSLGNKITLLEKSTNSGFSTTVNLGLKAATGEIIILLNTDVIPKKDFIDPLLTHFVDSKLFAVGCLDESQEGSVVVKRGRGVGTFYHGLFMHSRGEVDQASTLWVNGGSGAFRKSIWEEMGGMDEMFNPFYWEDIDLSYRAQKRGYRIVFEPKSIVEHSHSEGAIKQHMKPQDIEKIAYRNQFLFIWKNITDWDYIMAHFVWLPIHLGKAFLSGNANLVSGFLSALWRLDEIIEFRQTENSHITKADRDILKEFKRDYA